MKSKLNGAFHGDVRVTKTISLSPANRSESLYVNASATSPTLLRLTPWVVSSLVGASAIVGTRADDDAYLAADDIAETTPGLGTTKSFRLTADTEILFALTTRDNATGTLTLTGNAVAAETVTIGLRTYTFVESAPGADDVLIGASASDTLDNLIAAINGAAGEGTTYGTGTEPHEDVSASAGAGDTMVVAAIEEGTAGDDIDTTETMTAGSWGEATLEDTTAAAGQVDIIVEA